MAGRPSAEKALQRWRAIWRLKRQGHGQRAIARLLGIHLSSVQHYLRKGRPPPIERMVLTRHHVPLGQAPRSASDQLPTKGAWTGRPMFLGELEAHPQRGPEGDSHAPTCLPVSPR
jgi:Homeodomain-like domain-containing protein